MQNGWQLLLPAVSVKAWEASATIDDRLRRGHHHLLRGTHHHRPPPWNPPPPPLEPAAPTAVETSGTTAAVSGSTVKPATAAEAATIESSAAVEALVRRGIHHRYATRLRHQIRRGRSIRLVLAIETSTTVPPHPP